MKSRLVLYLFAVALAVACGQEAAPTPLPPPPVATATSPPAVPTIPPPVVTATPPRVATAVSPATVTPFPSPVPSPTSAAEPTTAPVVLLAPEDFGPDRNPLTGELVAEPDNLTRRPIAAKISNAPAQWVRPQSGLNSADVVFEHLAEGNLTRFTAIFYSQTPVDVGPIRSARLIDIEIPAMYDAALAFSGSSVGVSRKIRASDFAERVLYANEPGFYRTGANKPLEHTLYADPNGWWRALDAKGQNRPPAFGQIMAFSSQPPANGEPAVDLSVDYRQTVSRWQYDPATTTYRRWSDGEPLVDATTGEQLFARNVVVVFANHQTDFSICETQVDNRCLAFSIEIQIWGEGRAWLFRDGQRFTGTWRRVARNDMLILTDADGQPLPLQLGNTWFQMVPTDFDRQIAVSTGE